jgi:hypothetical protein
MRFYAVLENFFKFGHSFPLYIQPLLLPVTPSPPPQQPPHPNITATTATNITNIPFKVTSSFS